jgi:hypothetical protein
MFSRSGLGRTQDPEFIANMPLGSGTRLISELPSLWLGLNGRERAAERLDGKSGEWENVEHQPVARISRSRRRGSFRVSCL